MQLQSALDLEELATVGRLTLASDPATWGGAPARCIQHYERCGLSVPPMNEDILVLHLTGPTRLRGRIASRQMQSASGPGDLYLIPRGDPSAVSWVEPCYVLHIYLPRTSISSAALDVIAVDPERVALEMCWGHRDAMLEQLCLALHAELRAGDPAGRLYVESLNQTLILHLLRQYANVATMTETVRGTLSRPALRRVLDYIEENLAHDLSLGEIAGIAALSPYHFTRLFRRAMGCSPYRYVIERRLERARRLIGIGHHTLAEIAAQAGFADQSHMSRHFKQRYGVSPRAPIGKRNIIQLESKNLQDERHEPV